MCRSIPKITKIVTDAIWYNFDTPINQAEEEDDEDIELSEELARELEQKDDNIQPYQEFIETTNHGIEEDPKEMKLGATLERNVKERLIKILHEYVDSLTKICLDWIHILWCINYLSRKVVLRLGKSSEELVQTCLTRFEKRSLNNLMQGS